jgi:hypothetical protein
MRSEATLRESLSGVEGLGGVLVASGAIGRPEGSLACGLVMPKMRPALVVERLALPPATRQVGPQ